MPSATQISDSETPQQAGQLLPWECCFFLSQELGWLEVSLGSCTKAEG